MNRRFPVFRVIFLVIAVVLLAFSVHIFCGACSRRHEINAAQDLKIGQIDADLSRPGQYRVEATRQSRFADGTSFYLCLPASASGDTKARPVLSDLKAQVTLVASDKREMLKEPLDPQRLRRDGDEIRLYGFGGGPERCTLVLDVEQGASSLAGLPQSLYARQDVCGVVSLAFTLTGIVSLAGGLSACLILFGVARYTRKHSA